MAEASEEVVMRAEQDYTAANPDELSFKQGDIITISDTDTDPSMYFGTLDGKSGFVPASMVAKIEGRAEQSAQCPIRL